VACRSKIAANASGSARERAISVASSPGGPHQARTVAAERGGLFMQDPFVGHGQVKTHPFFFATARSSRSAEGSPTWHVLGGPGYRLGYPGGHAPPRRDRGRAGEAACLTPGLDGQENP